MDAEDLEDWGKLDTYDRRGVRVMREQCATCIFRPGNLMHLLPGRVKDMVDGALRDDSAIVCHDTLEGAYQAVCRGFWDKYDTTPLQVARRMGWWQAWPLEPTCEGSAGEE